MAAIIGAKRGGAKVTLMDLEAERTDNNDDCDGDGGEAAPGTGGAEETAAAKAPAPVLRVGRYKGRTFDVVLAADKGYCSWVLNRTEGGELEEFAAWLREVAPQLRETHNSRIYLRVPFTERQQAKGLGARWDAEKRRWYAPNDSFAELLATFGESAAGGE